jgi:hypothetical protein
MTVDVFDHMEEAWKLERNPFPAGAIRVQDATQKQPYSPEIFPEEENAFRRKFIRSGVQGGPAIGFLWSQGVRADTGFGKTTLMQAIEKEINQDLGTSTLSKAGAKSPVAIAAAYSNLNGLNAAGLYPVLFNAALDLTMPSDPGGTPILDQARARIIGGLGGDDPIEIAAGIESRVRDAWAEIGGTAGPLRPELVQAFALGGSGRVRTVLSAVSPTTRLRNGLQYLDFALAVLAGAGINHLFLMIDQLEDLATVRSVTPYKRSREIGRIRDLLESTPYATRLHMIFTFHNRAAQTLERFWEENRLPPFEASPNNTSAVVLLRGIRDTERARELVRVYLEGARTEPMEDDILPFEPAAVEVLCEISDGRPGVLLDRARELLNAGAEQGLPKISGTFARQYFEGQAPSADAEDDRDVVDSTESIDDLLLGGR